MKISEKTAAHIRLISELTRERDEARKNAAAALSLASYWKQKYKTIELGNSCQRCVKADAFVKAARDVARMADYEDEARAHDITSLSDRELDKLLGLPRADDEGTP